MLVVTTVASSVAVVFVVLFSVHDFAFVVVGNVTTEVPTL